MINKNENINHYTFNINNDQIGLNPDLIETLQNGPLLNFYNYIVSNDIMDRIVKETNKYATQQLSSTISPHARLKKWYDTNQCEIKPLFGLLIWKELNRII